MVLTSPSEMDSESNHHQYDLTQENIQLLKDKYSKEMKDDENNPIKICIKLIFEAATERNPIKRSETSKKLCEFLTKPNGLINLFLALIDFDSSSQKVTTHNQRFIAVANIIACLPELSMSFYDYCQIIFDQLKPLLLSENKQYSTLACIILKSILESNHAKCQDIETIIFGSVFKALAIPDCKFKPHESILIIYNLLENHVPVDKFVEIFPNLFYSLNLLKPTPSRLKSVLKGSMVNIINGLNPGVACCLLEDTLIHKKHLERQYVIFPEEEEISIRIAMDDCRESQQEPHDSRRDLVISILEDSSNELLTLEFFFHFKEAMLSRRDCDRELCESLVDSILQRTVEENSNKLDLFNIVATNSKRSIELVTRTLLNYVCFFRSKEDTSKEFTEVMSQSISSCCSILEVLLATISNGEDKVTAREKCLPVLKELIDSLTSKDSDRKVREARQAATSVVNSLESNCEDDSCTQLSYDGRPNKFMRNEFDSITKDLNDKLVPVRVHALVRLKQMIIAREQHAIDQIPQLYSLTLCFLGDAEPYVFLACIYLMAEMAIRKTDIILPKLCDLYLDKELDLQKRLNVGEVLVRLFKQLNETAPHYAQQVINVLFTGCKDIEELVRASSLTNIGELCRNLGHSLGKYVTEVLHLVRCILETDTMQVKRAAIDLLRTLLSGLKAENVESVQRDLVLIYKLLKKVIGYRQVDDEFSLQLGLALVEVRRLATELMDVGSSEDSGDLVKNIRVLSVLPK